jgi:hypothetical protein
VIAVYLVVKIYATFNILLTTLSYNAIIQMPTKMAPARFDTLSQGLNKIAPASASTLRGP